MTTDQKRSRVVAVVGSPRPDGNTVTVVKAVLQELEGRQIDTELLFLPDYRVYPCEGHDTCGSLANCPLEDDMPLLLEKVYGADGAIFASPVYYENVTAQLKAFMDRTVWQYNHERWLEPRVFGLVAVAYETGLDDTIAALRRFIGLSTQREIPVEVLTGLAYELGDAAGNADLMAAARDLAVRLAGHLSTGD